jgi:predicted component of type VI protein secretion system
LVPLKGEAIVVDADEALVGREANCNVVVSHPSVSRRHALIKRKQDVFFVVDQGSANGTFVDSKRIVDAALKEGTVLRFGSATFKVELRDEIPVESVAEDELVVSATIGPQTFSATVLEGDALPESVATPQYGSDLSSGRHGAQASTVQSPVLRPPPSPEPRPRPSRTDSRPPSVPSRPAPVQAAPNRGPAFWLMLIAAAAALLFVGAALGLGAAFLARRMGWL